MKPCVLLLILAWVAPVAMAQRASLRGSVSDSTGGVLPGVSVIALNVDQGLKREATTDTSGSFSIPLLQPGNYVVSAEKSGFAILEVTELLLHVGDARTLQLVLPVAKARIQIRVNDRTGGVETVNPTLGQVVTGDVIRNAPLDGRDLLGLAVLQPGVLPVNGDAVSETGFTVGGNRTDSVTFLLDGAHNNNLLSNGITYNPNPDTIAEFRVLTSNYTADFGRNGGGIISVVSKSGTNALHGTIFDFLRNDALNGNTFFNKNHSFARPILKRNQFGGTFGGPVTLPGVPAFKNRLFFFAGYQGERQSEQVPSGEVTTYTPDELKGDFTRNPSVVSFLQRPQNSFFRQPNQPIGWIQIDPVAQNYINAGLIPSSSASDGSFSALGLRAFSSDEFTLKLDLEATTRDKISVTLGGDRGRIDNPFSFADVPNFPTRSNPKDRFANGTYVRMFSPRLIDEFRLTAHRSSMDQGYPLAHQPFPSDLGIAITPDLITGPPALFFDSGLRVGFSQQGPTRFANNTFSVANALTWSRSRHTWKVGGGLAAYQNNTVFAFLVDGLYSFTNDFGANGFSTGSSLANFFLGLPTEYQQGPDARSSIRSKTSHLFLSDEWRVNQRLVLTSGLRYEYSTPKSDTAGRTFSVIPGRKSQIFPGAPVGIVFPGDPGAPRGANFPDKTDFAPRFGFAWDMFGKGKTSLRGGFGVFHNILKADDNLQFNGQPPFYSSVGIFPDPTLTLTSPPNYLAQPFISTGMQNPFPSRPPNRNIDFNAANFLPIGSSGTVFLVDPHLRTPYIYQYNLSLQHDLGANTLLELNYVGSSSRKLTTLADVNPVVLGTTDRVLNTYAGNSSCSNIATDTRTCSFAQILQYGNVSSAQFNSLEASLRKEISHGRWFGDSYFTLAYTFSHNIDNASGSSLADNRNTEVPAYNHNLFRASSDFDLRHRIVFSGGWRLPVGEIWRAAPRRLTQGWRVFPIVRWRTGFPLDVFANLGNSTNYKSLGPSGAGDPALVRASLNSPLRLTDPHQLGKNNGYYWFDPTSFCQLQQQTCFPTDTEAQNNPSLRTYGNLPRNFFRGAGAIRMDMAFAKATALRRDHSNLEFRADFFNLFNHTNYTDPDTNIDSSTFGQVIFAGEPRIIQLSLRLTF